MLSVRVLGELDLDSIDPSTLGSRKARTLVRLLALARGRFVPTDVLADALWGEDLPGRPGDQVAVLVSRIRAALGRDRVERGEGSYRLVYDWLDIDELAGLVAQAEERLAARNPTAAATAATAALSLVRGDHDSGTAAGEWVEGELAAVERLVARAGRVAAAALLESGNWLDARDLAAARLDRDPLDEDALRLLMRANVAGGRVGAALAAHEALRQRLSEDLGADPSPETEALHLAILRRDSLTRRPDPGAREPAVVGRDAELARLDAAALRARAGPVLVVVEGEAGIGKSTLVRGWVSRHSSGTEHARSGGHAVVLTGQCGEMGRSLPLDALMTALTERLRALGQRTASEVMGPDRELLAPLLGLSPAANLAPLLADGVVGPVLLYEALAALVERIGRGAPTVLVLEDAHRAGPMMVEWLRFIQRRPAPLLVIATVRPGEGEPLPATERILVGSLDRAASIEIVGAERGAQLHELSGGNPLFLTELARADAPDQLPASLVEGVSTRCDDLGAAAAATLRAAAVVDTHVDLDLLAAVLRRPALAVLEDVEAAAARGLLVEADGAYRFRHELVRAALAARVSATRLALVHRQAGRALARRHGVDPLLVADHARRGGDLQLAARWLRTAAARVAALFDNAGAEALLDEAIGLWPDHDSWLERARIRVRRGRCDGALADVERSGGTGAAALEVAAWAAYFDRRFDAAAGYADAGAGMVDDAAAAARCVAVGGRIRHAAGDLARAERLLSQALTSSSGADRVVAGAWLGVLRSHQGRVGDALELLRPATNPGLGAELSTAVLHALLFTAHAEALAGRTDAALEALARYDDEAARRQVPRVDGRGTNFSGWILRNLGAADEARERHQRALDLAVGPGTGELRVAALEDLAEDSLARGDPEEAARRLAEASAALSGDLVFGWRLVMKHRLLSARLLLATGEAEGARSAAAGLAGEAAALGIPRYAALAGLLARHAAVASGEAVDLPGFEADLDLVDRAAALESWWLTADTAAALGVPAWLDRAADRVARLAAGAGPRADGLRAAAGRLLSAR